MFKSLFELSTVRHNATSLMGPSSSRRKSGGGAFVPVVEQPPVEQSETSFVVEGSCHDEFPRLCHVSIPSELKFGAEFTVVPFTPEYFPNVVFRHSSSPPAAPARPSSSHGPAVTTSCHSEGRPVLLEPRDLIPSPGTYNFPVYDRFLPQVLETPGTYNFPLYEGFLAQKFVEPRQKKQDVREKKFFKTQQAVHGGISRRYRHIFTDAQCSKLMEYFNQNPFLPKVERNKLAILVGLDEVTVQVWFKNQRAKRKKLGLTKQNS